MNDWRERQRQIQLSKKKVKIEMKKWVIYTFILSYLLF